MAVVFKLGRTSLREMWYSVPVSEFACTMEVVLLRGWGQHEKRLVSQKLCLPLDPWEHPRPGLMGLVASWASGRCPCPLQG